MVDGATVTMPDTPENQAAYPQLKIQRPGCGFPIARLVVVFSLAVGTVLNAAIAKYQGKQTGENSLFRQLHDLLDDGDVVLADRYFGGWFDIALLLVRGVDVVVRKHQLRATDFRTGTRLGKDDHLVRWTKPSRPQWRARAICGAARGLGTPRSSRPRAAAGLSHPQPAGGDDAAGRRAVRGWGIATLYRRRWQAELYLRSIKVVLQMDHLHCKTPERVRNEIWTHLLGYNLIRGVMAMAGLSADVPPWCISFKGTLQTLNAFLPMLHRGIDLDCWCRALLEAIALHAVGNRPDRFEPRAIRRRLRTYGYMCQPRQNYRNRMLRAC